MRIFSILFLFLALNGFSANAQSGSSESSEPKCSKIRKEFKKLLSVSENKIDRFLGYFENNFIPTYPGMIKCIGKALHCDINVTTDMLAYGTSKLSGKRFSTIMKILNGTTDASSLFPYPLNCIKSGLLYYQALLQNITKNKLPRFEKCAQKSPVNANSPCSIAVRYMSYYYFGFLNMNNDRNNLYISDNAEYSSIGQRKLFITFLPDLMTCRKSSIFDCLGDLMNGNTSYVKAYIRERSSLPPPFSCIKGIVKEIYTQVHTSIDQLENRIVTPTEDSSEEVCKRQFVDKFSAFYFTWMDAITNITHSLLNNALDDPCFVPAYVSDILYEAEAMVSFAANATSVLSSIPYDVIYGIVNGTVVDPFPASLDCITSKLYEMHDRIAVMRNNFVSQLQKLAIYTTVDISTCSGVYSYVKLQLDILVTHFKKREPFITAGVAKFSEINFGGLYLYTLSKMLDSTPKLIGNFVASAVNEDPDIVIRYLSGETVEFSYPLSCVKTLIDVLKNAMNEGLDSLTTNTPLNFTVPTDLEYAGNKCYV